MTDEEEWRPVVGYEGVYEVSSLGRVKSVARGQGRRTGRILRTPLDPGGYPRVCLRRPAGKPDVRLVHRLAAEAFLGPAPEGKPNVLHWDDDKTNNRVGNLRWGSQSDNIQDTIRNGNHKEVNKTHCKRGHKFTEENTYVRRGARSCRTCQREARLRHYRRQKEVQND